MKNTVFFSWQSDRPTKEGRNLIEKALKVAVSRIANDASVVEAVREGLEVDKDTKGVPRHPPLSSRSVSARYGIRSGSSPICTRISKMFWTQWFGSKTRLKMRMSRHLSRA